MLNLKLWRAFLKCMILYGCGLIRLVGLRRCLFVRVNSRGVQMNWERSPGVLFDPPLSRGSCRVVEEFSFAAIVDTWLDEGCCPKPRKCSMATCKVPLEPIPLRGCVGAANLILFSFCGGGTKELELGTSTPWRATTCEWYSPGTRLLAVAGVWIYP